MATRGNDSQASSVQMLNDIDEAVENDPRTQLIKLIVEFLTGKKIATIQTEDVAAPFADAATPAQASTASAHRNPPRLATVLSMTITNPTLNLHP